MTFQPSNKSKTRHACGEPACANYSAGACEIDKANIEFPKALLFELDQISFDIVETGEHVKAKHRPIVVIASNSEKELPDAFLRRCLFHYNKFPDPSMMGKIAQVYYPDL